MSVSTARTVRELALEIPEATRIFEKAGIDYCCGGGKSLEQACAAADLSVDDVLDSLELAEQETRAKQKDCTWQTEPLAGSGCPHQRYAPQIHAGRDRETGATVRQGGFGAWQEPSRTAGTCGQRFAGWRKS